MMPALASAVVRAKAEGLLTAGRVTVVQADDSSGLLVASVQGDSGSYTVFRDSASEPLRCNCRAASYGRSCAHRVAAALVAG